MDLLTEVVEYFRQVARTLLAKHGEDHVLWYILTVYKDISRNDRGIIKHYSTSPYTQTSSSKILLVPWITNIRTPLKNPNFTRLAHGKQRNRSNSVDYLELIALLPMSKSSQLCLCNSTLGILSHMGNSS